MRTRAVEIAPGVHWLSFGAVEGNVYLVRSSVRLDDGWVLVDTSTAKRADDIRRAAAGLFGDAPPTAILITHVHPDHTGSAGDLARGWGCAVHVPAVELPLATAGELADLEPFANLLDRRIVLPLMRRMPPEKVRAMLAAQSLADVARPLETGDGVPGLPGWTVIAAPGHSPGHLVYWRRRDRVLLAGDTVLTVDAGSFQGLLAYLFNPRRPRVSRPAGFTNWDSARASASVKALARLEPRVLATGHGPPLCGGEAADRLRACAAAL
ncbi:MAG: MBL fold metallo-hydrolase [Candidatus Coatesbacteria bacterium]|nr:MBL fold metallo-hydrolase [Candidatus Coatesbacteria bacterium]